MTANPWPSSDWMAFVSERGIVAAGALLGVFAILFLSAARRWRDLGDGDAILVKVTLIATIVATMVVSAFDAVLLLGAPSLLAWSLIGATSGFRRVESVMSATGRAWKVGVALMLLVTIASVARSAGQLAAISTVGTGWSRTAWLNASRWDPGSYRINQRMAETWASRGACKTARAFALQAQSLFPHAAAPKRTLRRCGG